MERLDELFQSWTCYQQARESGLFLFLVLMVEPRLLVTSSHQTPVTVPCKTLDCLLVAQQGVRGWGWAQ